ncbi:MAG: DUF4258 domain-containing protein [SAR324 cluster bacterium]|nr:DUF4258 domain-containing protein [SAR324 cluster bacterium]
MRDKIRFREYIMTTHAEEEMDDDNLTIFDVENVLLTGRIIEHQKDKQTQESKYLVRGQTMDGVNIAVIVTKFGLSGKLVILTVYVE